MSRPPAPDSTDDVAVEPSLATSTIRKRDTLYRLARTERQFLMLMGIAFFAAAAATPYPNVARWIGFVLAAYSAIANDSIQTIGTFLASNKQRRWWVLWLFVGGVFLATVTYSWFTYGGDVSYERLTSKGFAETPVSFSFFQVAAPIFLLILTRLRMPVSTTFLLLSSFSSDAGAIGEMLVKSVSGYGVSFVVALTVWMATSRLMSKAMAKGPAAPYWVPLQWLSTAALWSVWIQQDAANIAVYLPRSLSAGEFVGFAGFITLGLGVLMYLRGDRIQQIVNEKSHVVDVRPATVIDFVYACLLYYFKQLSTIPMSTTWVFLGLLAGRELAISLRGDSGRTVMASVRLAGRDVLYAGIGLAVSIALAFATNPNLIDFDGDGAEARALEQDAAAREAHRDSIDAGLLILNPDGTVSPGVPLPVAPTVPGAVPGPPPAAIPPEPVGPDR